MNTEEAEEIAQAIMARLGNRMEDHEKILSQLLIAYVELFAIVSGLYAELLIAKPETEQTILSEKFQEYRSAVFASVREAAQHGTVEGGNLDLAQSLADMARKQSGVNDT